ncbi:MAG: sugar phosphate isomerase/epimerase, partial [Deltaproteobacteria bacterium]|nr:sugar phosphate isomerase/epimerase [Deltaproteobacteria bacterium]
TPMRLGSTSYIYPADIVTNVRMLAGRVRDVELVLFECDEQGSNLPDEKTIAELVRLGSANDMTYTVHLPLDLALAGIDPSIERAAKVICSAAPLMPAGYIIHLDDPLSQRGGELKSWLDNSLRSLAALCKEVEDTRSLCVENLDDQPPEMLAAIVESAPVSLCVDVGHLWKQELDPLPWLSRWLPRARVVHLHGIGERDHQGLSLVPEPSLDPVVDMLVSRFGGVVTFEVFNEADLLDSMKAFQESVQRNMATRSRHPVAGDSGP